MKILILPGLFNSGSSHWQTKWESQYPDFLRVEQDDWETPVCDDWVETLEAAVSSCGDDVVLVAHSLACTLVCKWAERYPRKIKGALLVAPSDTEAPIYPAGTTGFVPMSRSLLPFPSIVATSSDDEYVALERAKEFAACWGSKFVCVGECGHIGSSSGLGFWPEGLKLLAEVSGDERFVS